MKTYNAFIQESKVVLEDALQDRLQDGAKDYIAKRLAMRRPAIDIFFKDNPDLNALDVAETLGNKKLDYKYVVNAIFGSKNDVNKVKEVIKAYKDKRK